MFNAIFRAYTSSALALKADFWPEKIIRNTICFVDLLRSAVVFHARRFLVMLSYWEKSETETEQKSLNDVLLAVYCLKVSGLTFDFMTFLGTVEMERRRRRLSSCRVIIYAPPEFPIYQWQRHKIYNNMDGKPLIKAKREHVLAYVLKLTEVSLLFSTTMRCEVVCEWGKLVDTVLAYPHSFPRSSRWTGRFYTATVYANYLKLKYQFNNGRDAVSAPSRYVLGSWFKKRLAPGKLIVTLNLRNQNYSTSRNTILTHWDEFFSNPFIKKHFHFIIFNDAETPVMIKDTECITFCDKYIHDNFRRFKLLLNNGLHIGVRSGSTAIIHTSDTPYILFGSFSPCDFGHLDSGYSSVEGDYLFYDNRRPYQIMSLNSERIFEGFFLLLSNIIKSPHVFARYPDSFRARLKEVLLDWPSQVGAKEYL